MKLSTLTLLVFISYLQVEAQPVAFTQRNELLNPVTGFSGYQDCVVDMNGDFLDDIVRIGGKGVFIDYQQPDKSFTQRQFNFPVQAPPSWSLCAGDLDNNGYNDLLFAHSERVSFVMANENGTDYTEVVMPVFIQSQRSTISDINNDGWLDAFVCHESDLSWPFRNTGHGEMVPDSNLIVTADLPGNYSAIWTDYDNDRDTDLYISKCYGGTLPGDPIRTNLLYRNNSDGTYTEVGAQAGVDDNAQSWSTAVEDFDNDGDFDAFVVNHDFANRLYRNNGDGTFTDVIQASGIEPIDLGAFENSSGDFNNDGFMDIFSDLSNRLYLGNGDLTFQGQDAPVVPGGIGDLNGDGFLDVYHANRLFINDGNENHWIKINPVGIESNRNGIGARVEIYGEWGIQVREVRSGQSFSPMSSLNIHFGIDQSEVIDSLIIRWPSGVVTRLIHPVIDTSHIIPESDCLLSSLHLDVSGPIQLCSWESISLSGPEGFIRYEWSNGDTTQFTTIDSAGHYFLVAIDSAGCTGISQLIKVETKRDTVPAIIPSSGTRLCAGDTLILFSTPGENYRWSTGEILTQSIEVTESGHYTVAVDAHCVNGQIKSDTIEVVFLPADVPVIESVFVMPGDSVLLVANGDNIQWYDLLDGGNLLASGNEFQTSVLNSSATYYVESHNFYPPQMQSGGKPDTIGGGGLPLQGGDLLFETWETFILNSVTVYVPAGGPQGVRFVHLYSGDSLVAFKQFTVHAGINVLELNFDVSVGQHRLSSPQGNLFRNSGSVGYPYPIGDAGVITGSTHGDDYYYYFYDWKITKPEIICISERIPFQVIVSANEEINLNAGIIFFPNPASTQLIIQTEASILPLSLSIYNSLGEMIYQSVVDDPVKIIEIDQFVPGVYQLFFKNESKYFTEKIIIQRKE